MTHLCNQHVEQDHNHNEQEGHVHGNREPPVEGGEGMCRNFMESYIDIRARPDAGMHVTVYRQHSLVANILSIIIISKVLASEDPSSLNKGP